MGIDTASQRGSSGDRAVALAVSTILPRAILRIAVVLVAAAVLTSCGPTMSADERYLLDATNGVRAGVGRKALVHNEALAERARWWAGVMASDGKLRHSDLRGIPIAYTKAGENVGMGGSVETVHRALVASSGHYANMVDKDFNRVGFGAARASDGTVWVVEIFCRC